MAEYRRPRPPAARTMYALLLELRESPNISAAEYNRIDKAVISVEPYMKNGDGESADA